MPLFAVCAAVFPRSALAVDFETIPGLPAPIDTMQINSHFWSTAGVRFEFEGGGYPALAQRGGVSPTAFTGPGGPDAPAVGAPVGDFFITSPTLGVIPSPLRIVFAAPVQSVSGVLIDVDGLESWSVEAWGGGVLRASIAVNPASPGAGDGTAAPWSFVRGSPDIDYVRLVAAGPAGWAVDNIVFAPVTPVTIPPSTAPIDFESLPVLGAPTDRLEINTHFRESHGVTFSLSDGTSPELAQVGDPLTGFAGPPNGTTSDTPLPVPDQGVGQFFLTDDGLLLAEQGPALIVSYNPPTAEASGVVVDVDGDETFTVEARRLDGTVVQSAVITAGDAYTGDGVATPWFIRVHDPIVTSIRFQSARPGGGVAAPQGFDRFSPRSAPPPVPVSPLGVAGLAIALGVAALLTAARRAAPESTSD